LGIKAFLLNSDRFVPPFGGASHVRYIGGVVGAIRMTGTTPGEVENPNTIPFVPKHRHVAFGKNLMPRISNWKESENRGIL
jgi:hypothetical protein